MSFQKHKNYVKLYIKKEHGKALIELEGNIGARKIPAVSVEKIVDLRLRELFGLIRACQNN